MLTFIISEVLWRSLERNFTVSAKLLFRIMSLEIMLLELLPHLQGVDETIYGLFGTEPSSTSVRRCITLLDWAETTIDMVVIGLSVIMADEEAVASTQVRGESDDDSETPKRSPSRIACIWLRDMYFTYVSYDLSHSRAMIEFYWWPGANLTPGHLQTPSWWIPVGAYETPASLRDFVPLNPGNYK